MKMSGSVINCCIALLLALTSVSAVQRLNSIDDLKRVNFGQSVPEHSLVLLYWFANTIHIDGNVIRFTFDEGDYGSHHYGNFERLLDWLPYGEQYYTVGNIYQDSSVQLPSYVINHQTEDMERNIARIIIRGRGLNMGGRQTRRIDRVYITQHYETSEYDGTEYDAQHTYEISTNLLREIRAFSVGDNQQSLRNLSHQYTRNIDNFRLNDIRNTWHNLAGLGLLLFIVMQKTFPSLQYREQRGTYPSLQFREQSAHRYNTSALNFPENGQNPSIDYTFCVKIAILIFFVILLCILNAGRSNKWW